MTEPTYTLTEAKRILARQECDRHGHSLTEDIFRDFSDAVVRHFVYCERCGASFVERGGEK